MGTILVLGATGFVGSNTLMWLHKNGYRTIAACRDRSRLPTGYEGQVREGDLRNDKYLKVLFDGADVVVNCFSWSSLWGHKSQSEMLFLKPTLKLLEKFMQSKAKRYVGLSTVSARLPKGTRNVAALGIPQKFWPHLNNVIKIENLMREIASSGKNVVNIRLGIFVGENFGLGLLPVLLPRLKTRLVPWVAGGKTKLPLIDGRDCGQAMGLGATKPIGKGFHQFDAVGPAIPTVREVISYLGASYGYPTPKFSVPFAVAYPFAALNEMVDKFVPWPPLIVRSIVHLLEETGANNDLIDQQLGYSPQYCWQDSVRLQLAEMKNNPRKFENMALSP